MLHPSIRNARGHFMQHHELYPILGLKSGQHLPPEGFSKQVGETFICVSPADGGKHRVKVECHKCGRHVPFGRMEQHVKRKDHQS